MNVYFANPKQSQIIFANDIFRPALSHDRGNHELLLQLKWTYTYRDN